MDTKAYLGREDRVRIKNQVMGIIEKQNNYDIIWETLSSGHEHQNTIRKDLKNYDK